MHKSHFLVIVVVPGNEQDFLHNDYSAVTFEDFKGLESSNQKTRKPEGKKNVNFFKAGNIQGQSCLKCVKPNFFIIIFIPDKPMRRRIKSE